jgi:hypothetical protein
LLEDQPRGIAFHAIDSDLQKLTDSIGASEFCPETLSDAVQYYDWVYSLMCPLLDEHVLELVAGIGNLTTYLLSHGHFVTAID